MTPPPQDLSAELAGSGRLGPAQSAALGRSLARQLNHGHRIGAVYGQLSPFAVRVQTDQSGRKVYRLADPQDLQGAPSDPMCVAPEVAAAGRQSTASDVFALGAVILQAVTGRRGALSAGLPLEGPRSVPPVLWQVLVELTQPNPAYRPNAERAEAMFAGALEELRHAPPPAAAPPALAYEETRETSRAVPIVVLTLIFALVVGVGYYAVQSLRSDPDTTASESDVDPTPTGADDAPTDPVTEAAPPAETTPADETEDETDTETETETDDGPTEGAEYSGRTITAHGDEAAFAMPSANVWCSLNDSGSEPVIACTILEKDYEADAGNDPGCTDGNTVTMSGGDGPRWVCSANSALGLSRSGNPAASWFPEDGDLLEGTYAVLDYDYTLRVGPLSCTSRTTGVTCANDDSGHRFVLARGEFDFD